MKTHLQTGPGLFWVATAEIPGIPQGVMRLYCARVEAYDLPYNGEAINNLKFELLVAKGEGRPELARALLELGRAIQVNASELRKEAAKLT